MVKIYSDLKQFPDGQRFSLISFEPVRRTIDMYYSSFPLWFRLFFIKLFCTQREGAGLWVAVCDFTYSTGRDLFLWMP